MELTLGRFGGERLEKGGPFLCERLVAHGGKGVSVRGLGGGRAGEMRITRFLRNPKVTVGKMMATAQARTCAAVADRHVLAIQDSSALRVDEKGLGLSFHPVIAVDAVRGGGRPCRHDLSDAPGRRARQALRVRRETGKE